MNRIFFILIFTFTFCDTASYAQYSSTPVWNFGYHAGLDFRTGNPTPVQSGIYTHSAVSATQCDASGNVLFYANGFSIWDANGNVMQGSANPLWPNNYVGSWNLNAMIIPDAKDPDKYFVFTTFPSKGALPYGSYYVGQLTYSVVDMKLNNGMGDVVAGQNHVILDTNCGHYMTIIPGEPCKYWVVVQAGNGRKRDYSFKCYAVDAAGITPSPVTSVFNTVPGLFPNGNGQGVGIRAGNMIYSHTRRKIIASYESADITAYDFDITTGVVSNPVALTWAYPYEEFISSATIPAICLSPDESLLYVSGYGTSVPNAGYMLRQFPLVQVGNTLSVGNPVTIFNPVSSQFLAQEQSFGWGWQKSAMQLGPDNKIYHAATLGQNFVGRINNPNTPGVGCNFIPDEIKLLPNTYTTSSMPAPMFVRKAVEQSPGTNTDTTVCFAASISLSAPPGYSTYDWNNGWSFPVYTATAPGQYIVTSTDNICKQRNDTFDVQFVDYKLDIGEDISRCYDTILQPVSPLPDGVKYLWSDGSTGEMIHATTPGVYWVYVSAEECSTSDTVVFEEEKLVVTLPSDTTICTGVTLKLDANIEGAEYLWQDGNTEPVYMATGAGRYSVVVSKGFCKTDATVAIAEEYCDNCLSAVPNAFTPNHDGLNDVFRPVFYPVCPIAEYRFSIYNRFGQRVFHSTNPKEGWNGKYNGIDADLGTYYYYLKFRGQQDKDYFHKGDVVLLR